MSPEAVRLFFGCTISFLLGGSAGIFGLRTLYGDLDRVEPAAPRMRECPPAPACPPPSAAPADALDVDPEAIEPPPEYAPALPGLPVEAAQRARAAVRAETGPCLEGAPGDRPGVALLALTVTATGGKGFVSDATVSRATGDAGRATGCLEASARRARFEWEGTDGQTHLQLPLRYGR